ncbi:MAG: FAD-dependent oxidoreductase [Nitrospina sp.]|jgi:2,4-dienoyl-CoA reductase-like NADH-dependent reductase (Old Yellow Enzyme family)/thioredoxin reductase|nr:FAD-dependent oxidoreductase [Nitrospina sp.]
MMKKRMKLAEPGKIGSMTVRNRLVLPAMGTNLANFDGTPSQHLIDYYEARAAGGAGIIITEVVSPDERGKCIHAELAGFDDKFMPPLSRLSRAVKRHGAKCILQIAHAGIFASQEITGMVPIAPSSVTLLLSGETSSEASVSEVKELVEKYVQLAVMARNAGFDGIEIHSAHGYLPLQFLSPYYNKRTDDYGGSFENRLRFPREIVQGIRSEMGPDFPMLYRLSGEEYVSNGLEIEDTIRIAKVLEKDGVDAFHISAGSWDSRLEWFQQKLVEADKQSAKEFHKGVAVGAWVSPLYAPEGVLVHLAEAIKKEVTVPVIAVNSIPVEMAEDILDQGKADFISMGRGQIADPDLGNKVMRGTPEEVRACLRCNECLKKVLISQHLHCAVNVEAGNERAKIEEAREKKNILVVGGGPAGLEAARVASLRGHTVTLWEKDDALGGQLRVIALEGFKKAHGKLGKWYEHQLEKLNVTIVLNKKATEAEILSENPDVVILALGGEPSVPDIEGIDSVPVEMAVDVFQGKHDVKNKVVIIGGGLVGCELALKLAEDADREITVVEMLEEVASDMELFTKMTLTGYLSEKGVNTLTGSTVTKVMDNRILCVDMEGNQKELAFDNLILASGLKSRDGIYDKIEKEIETHVIGDGLNVSNIFNAVHDGFNIAMDI